MRLLSKIVVRLWWLANALFVLGMILVFFDVPMVWFEDDYALYGYIYLALSAYIALDIVVDQVSRRTGK